MLPDVHDFPRDERGGTAYLKSQQRAKPRAGKPGAHAYAVKERFCARYTQANNYNLIHDLGIYAQADSTRTDPGIAKNLSLSYCYYEPK